MLDLLAIDPNRPTSQPKAGRNAESNGDFFSQLLGASGAADDDYESPIGEDLGASDAGTREPAAPEQASPPADEPSRDEQADASVRDDRTQEAEDPSTDRSEAPKTADQAGDQQNKDGTQTGADEGRSRPAKQAAGETPVEASPAVPATTGDQLLPTSEAQPSAQTSQAVQPATAAAEPVPSSASAQSAAPGAAQVEPIAEVAPTQAATAAAAGAAEGPTPQGEPTTAAPEQPTQTTSQAADQPPAVALAEGAAPAVDTQSSDGSEGAAETAPKASTTATAQSDVAPSEGAARATAPELAAAAQQGTKTSDKKTGGQGTTPAGNGAAATPDAGQTGQTGQTASNGQAAQNATALADQLASTTTAGRTFNALVQGMSANAGDSPAPLQSAGGDTAPTQFQAQQLSTGGGLERASGMSGRTALADPSSQVAVQIQKAVTAKLSRFSISLEPAELGRVDVRLEFMRDGQVRATVAAERPETLELLQKDAQSLERALRDAGTNTKELSLSFDLSGNGRRDTAGNDDGTSAGDGKANDETLDGEEAVTEQQEPSRRVDGLIDIQV